MASWVETGASKTVNLSIISLPHPKLATLLHVRMSITRMPAFVTRLKYNPISKIGVKYYFEKGFRFKIDLHHIKKDAKKMESPPYF